MIDPSNPKEVAAFWSKYYRRLYFYCLRRLSSLGGAEFEAEDVTSDVLTEYLLKDIRTLRNPNAEASFLFRKASNHCINVLRAHSRSQKLLSEMKSAAPPSDGLNRRLRERASVLEICLKRLDANRREMLCMKYIDNLKTTEIAKKRGITSQGTGKALSAAEDILRRDIESKLRELERLSPVFNKCFSRLTRKGRQALRLQYRNDIPSRKMSHLFETPLKEIKQQTSAFQKSLLQCMSSTLVSKSAVRTEISIDRDALKWLISGNKNRRKALFDLVEAEQPLDALSDEAYLRPMFSASIDALKARCDHAAETLRFLKNDLSEAEARRALEHVARCAGCRSLVLSRNRTAPIPDIEALSSATDTPSPKERLWKNAALAASLLLLLVTGSLLIHHISDEAQGPDRTLTVKSAADQLFVAVRRGDQTFSTAPMDRLLTDDRLGFFYSSEMDGYLMILGMDQTGVVAPLYPDGADQSVPIESGRQVPLPVSAKMTDGSGCEWIVAVFSNRPLYVTAVTKALEESRRSTLSARCVLETHIEGARTVRIVPITR